MFIGVRSLDTPLNPVLILFYIKRRIYSDELLT